MMKRILAALCAAALLALTGCAPAPAASSPAGKEKLTVYATLFPQYDFAREIAGDRRRSSSFCRRGWRAIPLSRLRPISPASPRATFCFTPGTRWSHGRQS